MNLKIREAIANDYIGISNLVVEVHNLFKNNLAYILRGDILYENI